MSLTLCRLAEAEAAAAHPPPMVRPIPRPHPGGPHQYPPPQQRSRPPSTGPLGHAPKGTAVIGGSFQSNNRAPLSKGPLAI